MGNVEKFDDITDSDMKWDTWLLVVSSQMVELIPGPFVLHPRI